MDSSSESSGISQFVRSVPYYFAAAVGLAYAVGFLVEFTFANSMGVKDSLTDPFKAKHVYIGIICLFYPASVTAIVLALAKMCRMQKDASDPEFKLKARLYAPTGALFIIFLTAFYILIGMGRPDTFLNFHIQFLQLFILAICGPSLTYIVLGRILKELAALAPTTEAKSAADREQEITKIVRETLATNKDAPSADLERSLATRLGPLASKEPEHTLINKSELARVLRTSWVPVMFLWLLFAYAIYLSCAISSDIGSELEEMLKGGGYLHFGLFILIGFFAWRLDLGLEKRKLSAPDTVMPVVIFSLTIISALIYLSVIFFASRVYCYIPVSKGGGDFTTESPALLRFDSRFTNSLPSVVLDLTGTNTSCQSQPVYILQQNNTCFFLARSNQTNNPTTWRKLGHTNKPEDIFVIRKDAVVSYQFEQSH